MSGDLVPESTGAVPPWWLAYPEVWERERQALAGLGLGWEQQPTEAGAPAAMRGWVSIPAGSPLTAGTRAAQDALRLYVAYPSSYPWFPAHVWDRQQQLPWLVRHVAGSERSLCLIHDRDWQVDSTLAGLLARQLPALLRTGDPDALAEQGRDALARLEVPLPEPGGQGVTVAGGWAMLVDSSWQLPAEAHGGPLHVDIHPVGGSRASTAIGVVSRVMVGGQEVASLDWRIAPRSTGFPVRAGWLRLDGPPLPSAEDMYAQIRDRLPALELPGAIHTDVVIQIPKDGDAGAARMVQVAELDLTPAQRRRLDQQARQLHRRRAVNDGVLEIIGLYHPSEQAWREPGWGWVFLMRSRPDRRAKWQTHYVRAGYAGAADLQLRAPHAAALADARVLMVGLGAIGSRIADGLARAGVGSFTLVDSDVMEPGNAVRHLAGLYATGRPKTSAVARVLRERNPLLTITQQPFRVGLAAAGAADFAGHDWMLEHIAGTSAVIDAAADPAVSAYLGSLCHAAGVPLVHVSATAGAWGGVVATFGPGSGCWACLAHHRADGTVPVPPADPSGERLAPIGCAEPSFVGTAADLDSISTHAVRVITETLLARPATGTAPDPAAGSAAGTLRQALQIAALRDGTGASAPLTWTTGPIPVHPACQQPHHTAHAAA